ncbi:hypothetical protein Pd630_LPD06284 [Rhodococcus opacus PD630]|nr:hypothetical protein Pd630_LPD06284 [Rhodococcus opacus PD630]
MFFCPKLGRPGFGRFRRFVLTTERLVDLEQHLLLPLGNGRIREQSITEGTVRPLLEVTRLDVQDLRRHPETLGYLPKHLGRGLAQPTLDLTQIRITDTGQLRQLPHRHLGRFALGTNETSDVVSGVADYASCQISCTGCVAIVACHQSSVLLGRTKPKAGC